MIEKDSRYWMMHKEIYWNELLELDQEVQNNIINYPHSKEARLLESKVDRLIEERLVLN
tara:strand:+ start:416 stop:592 length:177 start_codon:yes stop_codon:yes gene_type:complete